MQFLSDDERREVLGEVLMDELKAIHEYVKDIPFIRNDVNTLKIEMKEVKSDISAMRNVLVDVSNKVDDHDHRLTILETVK